MNQEKFIGTILKNLAFSNSMSKEICKSIKPVRTRLGTMYALCKVHKEEVDGCDHNLSSTYFQWYV